MATNPFDYAERFKPREESNPLPDPVGAEIERMRQQEIRSTLDLMPSPDQAARVTRTARDAGVPPVMIEDGVDEAEQANTQRKFLELSSTNPALGRWALNNPRGAAAAQDDAASLGILGSAWDFVSKLPGRLGGAGGWRLGEMLADSWNTIEELEEGLLSPVDAALGALAQASGLDILDPTRARKASASEREQRSAYFRDNAARVREANRGGNRIVEGLLQGVESVPLTLGAIATRDPRAASAVLGGVVAGSEFASARRQGLDVGTSLRYGITQGAIEAVTERIPAGTLVDLIGRKTPWGKAFVRELGQEMTGEQLATFLQDMNSWSFLPENAGKSFSDFLRERPGAALDTALGVVGGTGVTTAGIGAAQRATDVAASVQRRVNDARVARAERGFIDRAEKAAEGSKLRQRDPEAFRDLVRHQAEEAGTRELFIPGEAVRAYQQSDGYDAQDDPFARYNVDEAVETGGDLVVPIEDALTDLVGTPAWQAVKDDVRLMPGGMSAREAQTFEESMDDVLAEMSDAAAKQAQSERAAMTVREKLVEQVATKLGDAGFTSPIARQYAELLAVRAQNRAARLGKELTGIEFDNLRIVGVDRSLAGEPLATNERGKQATAFQPHVDRAGLDAQQVTDVAVSEALRPEADGLLSVPSLVTVLTAMRGAAAVNPEVLDRIIELVPVDVMNNLSLTKGAAKTLLSDDAVLENAAALDTELPVAGGGDSAATVRLLVSEMARLRAEDVGALLGGREGAESNGAVVTDEIRQFNDSSQQRAMIQFAGPFGAQNSHTIITLFENRNLTSFLHELSHMWLEELRFDAETMGNPQVFADWETVKAWFKRNGHALGEDGQIPTEAHELFARAGERYVMEGKAPSTALARLFETFRSWLVTIYKTVDRLRAPITPEIREVFDRLLATDEEIAAAREQQGLEALFKDAASVGMSEAEFRAYQDQVENARTGAHAALLDKTMRAVRRRETERYREARKAVRAEEQERIDASPLYRAISLMREQRISREWIADEMGLDALDLLPVRVPPLYVAGGVHPDIIAEQSGHSSGRDMIEALIGAERAHRQAKEGGDKRSMRERAIETATDEEMLRRYGDPLNDGSIEREALAAVHSDMQGEVIASELRVLARRTGQRPTPYRLARDWARGKIRQGVVAEEASPGALQRYARNAAKAGRAAEQAMLKQDANEAFRQKQFQMLNNALLAEAKQAADEVEAAVKRMDKIARARTRKSIDQDYLEQAQALLEAVDLRKRSQIYEKRKGQWEAWSAAREGEGFDIVVPASFEATLGRTNWSRLSVENLLALDEAVKQAIHLGRLKQTLFDNQEQREWDAVFAEAETNADSIGRKPPKGSFTEPNWWDAIKSRAATVDAALLKMEQVFDWLDQGKSNGVFNRIVFRPIAEAQAREQDMTRDYFGRIREALEGVPPETLRHWGDKVTLDLIDPETGLPAVMERKKLIAMALNWGNAGNRQRLADGYGWSPQGIEAALMELTEPEWRFVQKTWDIIDTLWPEIEKMERAINGVAPEKVEAAEVVTPFGTLRGGYYPAIYDTTLDYTAEEHAGKASDLFEAKYTRATTRASATKDRMAKVSRPILLDVGVINRHLGEVIHDVTHREPVMRAHKFLTNRRVMRAVDETLGPEIRKQFRPWLQHIANSWAQDRAGNEGLGKFMAKARANATVVGMGWRFTTMLTQAAGYSNSFETVGAKWVSAAIAQTSAHPIETFEFVMARSGEMRNRLDTLDRDIRREMQRLESRFGATREGLTAAKRFAFHGIGYMDRVVAIPTWIGAYNKAISQGLSEADAAYAGDKAVRLSQGAAGPKDLAAVSTGQGRFGEAFKWLTMFYSYLSAVYSRQRNLGRDAARASAKDLPALMARAWWMIVVPPLLAEILSGRGPDDDEEWGWWAFKEMLKQSLGAIPVVRDLTEPVWAKVTGQGWAFDYRLSPVASAPEAIVRSAGDVGKIVQGKETKRATRNTLETIGYTTGLVPGQIAAAAQFLVDVGEGDADPKTISDWYTGLTKGRID